MTPAKIHVPPHNWKTSSPEMKLLYFKISKLRQLQLL